MLRRIGFYCGKLVQCCDRDLSMLEKTKTLLEEKALDKDSLCDFAVGLIKEGYIKTLKFLLDSNRINVNDYPKPNTHYYTTSNFLLDALIAKQYAIAWMLLCYNIEPETINEFRCDVTTYDMHFRNNALRIAIDLRSENLIKRLLEKGADPDYTPNYPVPVLSAYQYAERQRSPFLILFNNHKSQLEQKTESHETKHVKM